MSAPLKTLDSPKLDARVSPDLARRVRTTSSESGIPVSRIIEEALTLYFRALDYQTAQALQAMIVAEPQ